VYSTVSENGPGAGVGEGVAAGVEQATTPSTTTHKIPGRIHPLLLLITFPRPIATPASQEKARSVFGLAYHRMGKAPE
jgi:hypothetical protein